MKQQIYSYILMFLSIFIVLIFCEVFLIIKNNNMKNYDIEMWKYAKELKVKSNNSKLGHEHVPNKEAVLQSVNIRTNSFGLRGNEVRDLSQLDRRVLFLGSSVTLGWGVEEKRTMTEILNKKLGSRIEVLNAGIGNYNTVRYIEGFLTKLTLLDPSDIIIQYFVNDVETLNPGGGNWFLRNSQLAVTIWIVFNRFFNENSEKSLVKYYKSLYQKDKEGFFEMIQSIKKLKKYSYENGINLYFVMTPNVHDLVDYKFEFIHEIMSQEIKKLEINYIDLLPAFKNLKNPLDLWAMPGDPHPNALGHELMANYLYKKIF